MLADNGPPRAQPRGQYTRLGVADGPGHGLSGRPYHPQTRARTNASTRTLGRSARRSQPRALTRKRGPLSTPGARSTTPSDRARRSATPRPRAIAPARGRPQDHPRPSTNAGPRPASRRAALQLQGPHLNTSTTFAGKALALRATDTDGLFEPPTKPPAAAQIDLQNNTAQPVHHVPEPPSALVHGLSRGRGVEERW